MITMIEESFFAAAKAIPGFLMNAVKAHPATSTAIIGGGTLASTVDGIDHEVTTPDSTPQSNETQQPVEQNNTQPQTQQQPSQQPKQQPQPQQSLMSKVTNTIEKHPIATGLGAAGVLGAGMLAANRRKQPSQQSF